jgi:hypothetical protein
MVDNRLLNFRRECFAMLVLFLGGGPATRSALSATGASLREIRWQIHR